MANDETKQPETEKPQGVSGAPDGTVPPVGVPIEIFRQVIPVPSPQAAEELRAALLAHEEDACVKSKTGEGWTYLRTRAFVDLKKASEQQAEAAKAKEAKTDDKNGDGSGSAQGVEPPASDDGGAAPTPPTA